MLNSLKVQLEILTDEVLECMESNTEDQNSVRSWNGLLSAFDILSGTDYEKRLGKIEALYDLYGTVILQTVKETGYCFLVIYCPVNLFS